MEKEKYLEIISKYSGKSSRDVFGSLLIEKAEKDERIVALSADVSESVRLKEFKDKWPARFFNFGIAEQNMMGAAAGMARSGLHPYVSVYAIFAALRALELLAEAKELAAQKNVFTVPTILFYFDGKEYIRKARFVNFDELESEIERYYRLL